MQLAALLVLGASALRPETRGGAATTTREQTMMTLRRVETRGAATTRLTAALETRRAATAQFAAMVAGAVASPAFVASTASQ